MIVTVTDSPDTTRRQLTAHQMDLVDRLVDATATEVCRAGYDGVTVRSIAKSAGMAPATAYTYFSSKDHLLAEVLWRRFQDLRAPEFDQDQSTVDRVSMVLHDTGLFMADAPALAAAGTTALLGTGPDVKRVRDLIGSAMHHRLRMALGHDGDGQVLSALQLAWTGAMLSAGMGHLPFADVPDLLASAARLILGDTR